MGPPELNGAPGEELMGPLEQVGPLKQESTGTFGDNGGPLKLAETLEQVGPLRQESTGPFGDIGAPKASLDPKSTK